MSKHCVFLCALVPVLLQAQQPDTTRLTPLIVTAERVPVATDRVRTTLTVLDANALRAAGVTHVLEALRQVPGLTIARAGSFGAQASLFSRGGESDYTRVMIDGVPMNDPGGAIDLGALTLDDIERIEIVRGPASVVHGSEAVSAVVQLVTRRGTARPEFRLSAGGGSFGGRQLEAGASGTVGVAGWNASATQQRNDGILPFNNDYDNTVWSGRVSAGGAWPVSLTFRHGRNGYQYPTDGAGQVVDRNAARSERRTSSGLEAQRAVNQRLTVRLTGGWLQVNGQTRDPSDGPADTLGFYAYRSDGRVRRGHVSALADIALPGQQRLVAGVEWADEQQRLADSSNYSSAVARFAARRATRSAYTQLLGATGRLGYSVGARFDDNDAFGTFQTARANATVQLTRAMRWRAGMGNAFKAPTFFEQFSTAFTVGNPNLVPERALSWESAVEYRGARSDLTIVWFNQSFRDLIQYTFTSPTDPSYFNVAAARSRGAEVEGVVRLHSRASLRGGVTVLRTRVDNPGFDKLPSATFVRGSRLLRRPSSTWSLGATLRPSTRWTVDVNGLRTGARDDRDFSSFPAKELVLDPYTRIDASTQLRLTPVGATASVSLLIRAENLFGTRYQEIANFDAPRRNLFAGLRADWSR